MQTTCPECRTTFRVSQEQLGARRGLVRCGGCHAVFNAYDTLLPELETPPASALEAPADSIAPADSAATSPGTEPATDSASLIESLHAADARCPEPFELRLEPAVVDVPPAEAARDAGVGVLHAPVEDGAAGSSGQAAETALREEPLPIAPATEPMPDPASDLPVSGQATSLPAEPQSPEIGESSAADGARPARQTEVTDILLQPLRPDTEKSGRTWQFWLYLVIASLLALLLLLQTAYFLRGELAAALPSTRPLLEALCRPLACTVPLPRQLDKSAIAASSLEHDPENKSRVRLSLLLANRTGHTQAWPWIKLTLSDVRQSPVAQKIFSPEEYLPGRMNPDAGLSNAAEQEVRLDLDIGNLVASGYSLNLTYPH
jgi:predicted Zn finger-like uncharacterized protein